jgi:hypothetical protein
MAASLVLSPALVSVAPIAKSVERRLGWTYYCLKFSKRSNVTTLSGK